MSNLHDFGDAAGPVPACRHSNGGGWVADTAYVAKSACLSGDAQVSGCAKICGDAQVSGCAKICGDVWSATPLRIQGSRHHISVSSRDTLTIGCETRRIDEWLRDHVAIGRRRRYTDAQIAEYGYLIKVAAEWLVHNAPEPVA